MSKYYQVFKTRDGILGNLSAIDKPAKIASLFSRLLIRRDSEVGAVGEDRELSLSTNTPLREYRVRKAVLFVYEEI